MVSILGHLFSCTTERETLTDCLLNISPHQSLHYTVCLFVCGCHTQVKDWFVNFRAETNININEYSIILVVFVRKF